MKFVPRSKNEDYLTKVFMCIAVTLVFVPGQQDADAFPAWRHQLVSINLNPLIAEIH